MLLETTKPLIFSASWHSPTKIFIQEKSGTLYLEVLVSGGELAYSLFAGIKNSLLIRLPSFQKRNKKESGSKDQPGLWLTKSRICSELNIASFSSAS